MAVCFQLRYTEVMTAEEIEGKITRVVQKIAAEYDPEKIILFGSRAWGKPHKGSDVDFFIIKDTPVRRLERGVAVERIMMGSGIPIDALVYTPQEVARRVKMGDFIFNKILQKGKVLYER